MKRQLKTCCFFSYLFGAKLRHFQVSLKEIINYNCIGVFFFVLFSVQFFLFLYLLREHVCSIGPQFLIITLKYREYSPRSFIRPFFWSGSNFSEQSHQRQSSIWFLGQVILLINIFCKIVFFDRTEWGLSMRITFSIRPSKSYL